MELFNVDQFFLGLACAVLIWTLLLKKLKVRELSDLNLELPSLFIYLCVTAISAVSLFLISNLAWDWSGWIVLPLLAIVAFSLMFV